MPSLGAPELIVILAIVVMLFGANRIPEIMRGMGSGIREFRKATHDNDAQASEAPSNRTPSPGTSAPNPGKHDVV